MNTSRTRSLSAGSAVSYPNHKTTEDSLQFDLNQIKGVTLEGKESSLNVKSG